MCAAGYYRPFADSPVAYCSPCDAFAGVICGSNTTVATLLLDPGYWRHSALTTTAYRCKKKGSWSPCIGGDVGIDGDGYCAPGYGGPRCEVCYSLTNATEYFDEQAARCRECGDVAAQGTTLFCILVFLLLFGAGGSAMLVRCAGNSCARDTVENAQRFKRFWGKAGMPFKIKAMVGLYQCIAAVPAVFNMTTPPSIHDYTKWANLMNILEFASKAGSLDIIIPSSCFGPYRNRLLIGSWWPIGLLSGTAVLFVSYELIRDLFKGDPTLVAPRGTRAAIIMGLERNLPLTLTLTFVLVPSTATRIFKTFLCVPFEYDATSTLRYLHDDLSLLCGSADYTSTWHVALSNLLMWPVGVPVMYGLLLFATRDALRSGTSTPLSRSTAFLWAECSLARIESKTASSVWSVLGPLLCARCCRSQSCV